MVDEFCTCYCSTNLQSTVPCKALYSSLHGPCKICACSSCTCVIFFIVCVNLAYDSVYHKLDLSALIFSVVLQSQCKLYTCKLQSVLWLSGYTLQCSSAWVQLTSKVLLTRQCVTKQPQHTLGATPYCIGPRAYSLYALDWTNSY